ncbi:hypothetical protein VTJ83DRAFT_6038 [Remersonia thermophila]|uniref:Tyrosinase copper-binding domain-containing protein n=1 Tax=Remersonia thermophila TaxID=72144 RepID=A0ABR4D8P1_9PEZI
MKLSSIAASAAAAVAGVRAINFPHYAQAAIDSGLALAGLNGIAIANSHNKFGGSCNWSNVKIRKEWRYLSASERKKYIAAVQCLQSKPSVLDAGIAPGSKSLFDDFVWVHMNQTFFIHFTGNFFIWHRYFVHIYEEKLKEECGYTGASPYWEWGYDINDLRASPVFDGSDTSLGSDGEFIPGPPQVLDFGFGDPIVLEKGSGGGCLFQGPFKDLLIRLGPATQPDPSQDNPRCVKRDLNVDCGRRFATFRNTTEVILNSPDIMTFRTTVESEPGYTPPGFMGIHGGGHFMISGDPGSDAFISPGDPAFYLHHGQIDRVYWIWQMLDYNNRKGVFGTNTFLNAVPGPSANTTVEDEVHLWPLAPPIKIKHLMSTIGGEGSPLCYLYL